MENLIREVRQEFQIPPYFTDEAIGRDLEEGEERLKSLNPIDGVEKTHTYRMLLKNYVYYAYHHKVSEWEQNYANVILSWQLGSEVAE